MRIRISHETTYVYDRPARAVIQTLRLTPRDCDTQHVLNWRIELDVDGCLRAGEDALGNLTHVLSVDGPTERLTLRVRGDVETYDTHGVITGTVERFPDRVYLRETPLTAANADLQSFAEEAVKGASGNGLDAAHRLLSAVHDRVLLAVEPTYGATSAADAFAAQRGVCQDLSHIFIAAARHLGIPARYVSGYLARADDDAGEVAHAWAEACIAGLGWVGFDPANGISPTEAHVRVAVGLDYFGAAPIRGSRYGGGRERPDVALSVTKAMRQTQG
jgi:transglutaminase-like putative cysteine protease